MNKTDGIAVIDVVNNIGKYQKIPLSEFVTELEYILLETSDNCLIADRGRYIVTNTHIFVAGLNYNCYAFDRDGRFIGEIGRVGQGPGEYSFFTGMFIDENKQSLYIETVYSILEYTWNGVFHRSIILPKSMIGRPVSQVFYVQNNLFIGHNANLSGSEMYNFLLFNDLGQVVKSFDNHIKLDRTRIRYNQIDISMQPFRVSENIYVKEYPNDTLYCLNEQTELIPQFVFDLGKYSFYKEKRGNEFDFQSVISIPDKEIPMVGTSNYIFFSTWAYNRTNLPLPQGIDQTLEIYGHLMIIDESYPVGIYDRVNKSTRLLDTDQISRMKGLINDLDGGLSFWPKYYTTDNELVDVWKAYEMKEYLTEEYFSAHEIKNPQAHQKLKELLKTLDWDDNPVIVIGKLK